MSQECALLIVTSKGQRSWVNCKWFPDHNWLCNQPMITKLHLLPMSQGCALLISGSKGQGNGAIFMPPDQMIWGILFLSSLSVCLSVLFVCLFVCLSVINFNLRYNFWTVRDRDFIFGMHTPLMMPYQITPRSMTLWPWLWPWSQN